MREPPVGTCMAFDHGTRRIGVAVGQSLTGTVSGIASVDVAGESHFERIEALVREWRPARLVVGLPLSADGGETGASRAARDFAEQLGARVGLPVYFENEFLTSTAAQAQLTETLAPGKRFSRRKRAGRDLLAAELILRSHLESSTPRG